MKDIVRKDMCSLLLPQSALSPSSLRLKELACLYPVSPQFLM